jgi:fructosamine-3-kinase
MDTRLRRQLEQRLGSRVEQAHPVAGGCIHQAFEVRLADARVLFVKTNARPLPFMFRREAEGLRWLAEAQALRVPYVVAACDHDPSDHASEIGFLALEWIDQRRGSVDVEERLGRGLALLHRTGAPSFGHEHDNYIATLAQQNERAERWSTFYAERRLRPQLALAHDRGYVRPALCQRLECVVRDIDRLCGPAEPPSRLHGDLWSGNVIRDELGAPVLIDPAVYAGDREVDLAMMQLFGGFGPRCFAAYDEVYPRRPGHEARVALYQLYPLLVHLNLFGKSYVAALERTLDQLT